MVFVRLMNALMILLMLASLCGIAAAFANHNMLQLVIRGAFFLLSGFALTGIKENKPN